MGMPIEVVWSMEPTIAGLLFPESMDTVLWVCRGGLAVGPGAVVSLDTQGTVSVRGMLGGERVCCTFVLLFKRCS